MNFKQGRSISKTKHLRVESLAVVRGWEVEFGGIETIGHEGSAVEFFGDLLKVSADQLGRVRENQVVDSAPRTVEIM
jgi:hypothetical protein